MRQDIEGIVLGFKDVFARPKSGIWSIPEDFEALLDSINILAPPKEELRQAVQHASKILILDHAQRNIRDEYAIFTKYYLEVAKILGIYTQTLELIEVLAKRQVYTDTNYSFFKDASEEIPVFARSGMKLCILSNNWPSLKDRIFRLGLNPYIQTLIISSMEACCKPDPELCITATNRMKLPADRILFVDCNPANLKAAEEAGMKVVLMNRSGKKPASPCMSVSSLTELREKLL